jgi:hypothetical protein
MYTAGVEIAETGGSIANLLFSLTIIFCGYVLVLSNAYLLPWTNPVQSFSIARRNAPLLDLHVSSLAFHLSGQRNDVHRLSKPKDHMLRR